MIRSFLSLAALLWLAAPIAAQSAQLQWTPQPDGSYLLEWNVPALDWIELEGGVVFRHPDATPMLQTGAPDFCQFNTSLSWETLGGWTYEIEESEYAEYLDVAVLPSRGNLYRNVNPFEVPRVAGPEYSLEGFWPASPIALGESFNWRGALGQPLHLIPAAYRPSDGTLRVYQSMTIRFTPNTGPVPRVEVPVDPQFSALHAKRFLNGWSHDRYDQLDEYGRMLVLSPAEYMDAIAPWVQWKREKGLLVDVVDVEDVGSTVDQVQTYVAEAYASEGYGYLVLVGDEEAIPSELVVNGGGAGYCDPCYGFIEGNDHYPELLVGRFLAHDVSEVMTVVSRTLDYERTPVMDTDWFSRAIAIGSAEGAGFGDDGQSDWQHNNAIKEQLLEFTYTEVQELYDGSQGSSSPTGGPTADASGSPGPNQFANAVNAGASLINYTGHGSHNSIATTGFTNNNMGLLNNAGMWPYFIIVGCCVGDFDEATGSGDCFGELWSKLENDGQATGGIGGAFSSVLQSWAPPMEGQDEMNALIAELGQADIEYSLGGIHFHGCSGMIEAYGGGGEEMMDTWCLFGDPSLVLRTAFPEALALEHETELLMGVSALEILCAVEGAMVAATVDGELLGRGWIENGSVTLTFDSPLAEPGQILLTGTAFNHLPYQAPIQVIPPSGPYVIDESVAWSDPEGWGLNNANGIPESGERLWLDIEVTNVGIDTAFNAVGLLSSVHPKVEEVGGEAIFFGTLAPGESTIVFDAVEVEFAAVAFNDGEPVWFDLSLSGDDGLNWEAGFSISVRAPEWEWGACFVEDGNDGWLSSGETAMWSVFLTNVGGGAAMGAVADAANYSGPIAVGNSMVELGQVAPGESAAIGVSVTVDDPIPVSSSMEWTWEVVAGPYSGQSPTCSMAIDVQVEDWEVTSTWPWSNDANAPWFETDAMAYSGSTSMQSGAIGGNQTTELTLEVDLVNWGEVSFAHAVSSEADFDFLRFYVDGQLKDSWSGESDWATSAYVVFGGNHTLRWRYQKDAIASDGEDAAWIDQIILPPNATVVSVTESTAPAPVRIHPNPATSFVGCSSSAVPSTVHVTDLQGRVIMSQDFRAGAMRSWSVEGWPSGVYLVSVDGRCERLIVR